MSRLITDKKELEELLKTLPNYATNLIHILDEVLNKNELIYVRPFLNDEQPTLVLSNPEIILML